jgi:hypothetical protein
LSAVQSKNLCYLSFFISFFQLYKVLLRNLTSWNTKVFKDCCQAGFVDQRWVNNTAKRKSDWNSTVCIASVTFRYCLVDKCSHGYCSCKAWSEVQLKNLSIYLIQTFKRCKFYLSCNWSLVVFSSCFSSRSVFNMK